MEDTQGRLGHQSRFSAATARSMGFTAIPLSLARKHGQVAQTCGRLLEVFRQDGRTTRRTQASLAKFCGVSVRTLRTHLHILEEEGVISLTLTPFDTSTIKLLREEGEVLGRFVPLVNYARELPWTRRLVYAYLIHRAEVSPGGDSVQDSVLSIARTLGLKRDTVQASLRDLEGLIERLDTGPGNAAMVLLRVPANWGDQSLPTRVPKRCRQDLSSIQNKKNQKALVSRKMPTIKTTDLRDDPTMVALYMGACRLGIVKDSGQSRLRFWSAAEHALRVGDDPAALFAWIVNEGNWQVITDEDESRALDRLRQIAR